MKILELVKNKEKIKEIIVYGIFGVLTTIVSFGSFQILRTLFENINESILNTISIVISIIFAYFTNRKYVFKSKEKNILKELGLFFISRGFSALFEIGAFFILNELIKMDGLISKAIVSVFVIIMNYIMSKIVVFKKR